MVVGLVGSQLTFNLGFHIELEAYSMNKEIRGKRTGLRR